MKNMDKSASVLIILIMVVELIIVFRAFYLSLTLGLFCSVGFQLLDYVIASVHNKYFRNK